MTANMSLSHHQQPQSSSFSLSLQGNSYHNFINAIKSPATKLVYHNSLKRYLSFKKLTNVDDLLLHASNPRLIEAQIIDYIMTLRKDGVAYTTIQFFTAPLLTYYSLNDVVLNKRKITRYFGEYRKVVKDRAYTTEEIHKALQTADERMRMIILLLCSTGCRIGGLPSITLGNLTKLDYGMYKIVIYKGTNNEYYTFCTPEAGQAINDYLAYRQRCGEKLFFDENLRQWQSKDTPLIRQQFDINDLLQVRNPQPMDLNAIRKVLTRHLVKVGLRTVEHPTAPKSTKRVRKPVSLANGFRKFVISNFIKAQLNHEIRELLVDHSTMLDQNYFRPAEEEVLGEYMKAVDFLTISAENKLRREVQTLKQEVLRFDKMQEQIDRLIQQINSGSS
jgi:integrase